MIASAEPATVVAPSEWVKHLPRAPLISSADRNWTHLGISRILHPPRWRVELPPLNAHYIGLHMSGPCEMVGRLQGLTRRQRWTPGEVMIMSAGQSSTWEWNNALDELQLYLDPQMFTSAAAEISDRPVELLDGLGIIDPVISTIALQVSADLIVTNPTAPLLNECAAASLITRLLTQYSTLRDRNAVQRLDISKPRLRTALEYIDIHLDEDLKLGDIACAAGMSPFHFARGFRKVMGQPPHRYLLMRRVDRARNLLTRTTDDIMTIARQVGFASQSHFSAVFKRHCGMTPSQYRSAS